MKEFKDKEKNEYLEWIVNYIVEENFPKEHLIAIRHIVGLFNDCEESEKEIFDFSKNCVQNINDLKNPFSMI